MTTPIPYTFTNESVTLVYEGNSITVTKDAANFIPLRTALILGNWDDVPKNLTIAASIDNWGGGRFTFKGGVAKIDGEDLPTDLNRRITEMVRKHEDPSILFNFWTRLKKNPSYRSVKQLWGFLNHLNLPLSPDGTFFAYKSVRRDYKDHHSGNFDNSVGKVLKMPRNEISDDPQVACHEGFHVGAIGYSEKFGGDDRRVIICKVDPENVVCVPHDSSQMKMRVCEYKVEGNYGRKLPSTSLDLEAEREALDDSDDDGVADHDREEQAALKELEKPKEKKKSRKEKKKAKKAAVKKEAAKKEPFKPSKAFDKYTKMRSPELMNLTIDQLRAYAGKGLNIIGASKIPGGKTALVAAILKTRG